MEGGRGGEGEGKGWEVDSGRSLAMKSPTPVFLGRKPALPSTQWCQTFPGSCEW